MRKVGPPHKVILSNDLAVEDGSPVAHERAGDLTVEDPAWLAPGGERISPGPMAVVLPAIIHSFEHGQSP